MFAAVVFALSLVAGNFAIGQEEPALPKPGPEHEALKRLVGTWNATLIEPSGEKYPGTHTFALECGGLWLVSDYRADIGGLKLQGKGLDSYDQNKKKYVSVWVDSMSTAPMVLEGNYDETGKTLVMTGQGPGHDGKPTKVKEIFTTRDDDHFTLKMYLVDDAGKENQIFTLEYERQN
jgi:hypothetical protein